MERRGFLISLFLLNILIRCGGYWKVSGCLDWERKALTTFRKSLNDSSSRLSSWDDTSDCCNWTGITCNNKTQYVVHLDCSRLGLSDRIDPAVVELKHLQLLDLTYNAFNGIPIPQFVGSMKELRHLNLSEAGFSGRIPHQLGNLSHLISLQLSSFYLTSDYYPSLSSENLWWLTNLTSLKYLDMSYVNLSTASYDWLHVINMSPSLIELKLFQCGLSYISPTLASVNFTSLRVLDLSYNNFNSRIPNWIANISNLVFLDLSRNQLNGNIPAGLGGLSSLQSLLLSMNQLNGNIPAALGGLSSLQYLDLSENLLNGNIPAALGGLSSLKSLELEENRLNGTIPTSLGKRSNLSSLDLSDNSLTGNVSESLFENLKKLEGLHFSSNSLVFDLHPDWVPPFQLQTIRLGSSHLGPRFPPWLRTQKYVTKLDLSNTSISDIMPTWFWDLTPQLFLLNLSNNEISGQLPNLLKMQFYVYIDLSFNRFSGPVPCILNGSTLLDFSNNQFSGPIPPNFTSTMRYMEFFSAAHNQISGIIPSSIEELKHLVVLDLSQNNITGTIPSRLGNCVALEALDLSKNRLSGGIPMSLGLLSQLQTMHLNNNTLSGEVPSSLKNCSRLETLDLGYNNLSGHIPTWIGKSFPALRILSLRSNMFTGNIPPQLSNLTSLQILDVAQNCLSGTIPQSFENLTAMKNKLKPNGCLSYIQTRMLYYEENLLVTSKGQTREYTRTVSLVTCMDLSSNNLSGEIPEGVTSLLGLRVLNLSRNHFTRKIPDKIGKLTLLESLDFSKNQLSGTIRQSISNLTFLSYLNLSYNNLSGRIPLGNQLQTLEDPSNYIGNNGLCGPPLIDNCAGDETPQGPLPGSTDHVKENEKEYEMRWFYTAMGLGFPVGFWAFCGILVLKKSWRIAYYRFFVEMKERLFLTVALWDVRLKKFLEKLGH
ncbi:receptor-like protein EIX1 [Magnolia sinica]|uniref:receptor-like protein EIX1 n=1 Tax=Magnolia sinica TaxID=86752 RepID=UPI00265A7266|nr:receptor-like protein EIX1 [Magnolia sinica]